MQNSIEEKILKLQEKKSALAELVSSASSADQGVSYADIMEILQD
jgi:SNF2 family DNA or RNA helicase